MGTRQQTADIVVYEADNTCCICRRSGKGIQIHHLDGDTSNDAVANLAVLCLEHHDKASSRSTMSRRLSPVVIARYRDEWYGMVRAKRESALVRPTSGVESHEALMEALACHEVRKYTFGLTDDWDVVSDRISEISPFAASWSYGNALRAEVLDAMYEVACETRWGMPASVASEVSHLASNALPIVSLVHPTQVPPDDERKALLQSAVSIGFAIAYDGIKYLANLAVTAAGVRLLGIVLRYSHLNGLEETKDECLAEFGKLVALADTADDDNSRIWVEFERDDALALDKGDMPTYPREVAEEIRKLQR